MILGLALVQSALILGAMSNAFDADILAARADVAEIFDVPTALVKAVIHVESRFESDAVSRTGAIGLMQVMPFNAPKVGVTEADLWIPKLNILAGVRLLAVLLRHYEGDLVSTLVAYNARPRPAGSVTTDVLEIQFHRDHRDPGDPACAG